MFKKLSLYLNSIRYLKKSQIYYTIRKRLGLKCKLGGKRKDYDKNISVIKSIEYLDFDSTFLDRFDAGKIMNDVVTFLHESENFAWNKKWNFENHSMLWNFNLHYFEYGFSLIYAYRNTNNINFLEKLKKCIISWITLNPQKDGGIGWEAYTISLRLSNWLSFYYWLEDEIKIDVEFCNIFLNSIWEQYSFLSCHLEKHLLCNHYLENLKALIMCSIFFNDDDILKRAMAKFKQQCHEQILSDGMHFELSPMYHKIILEDLIRVSAILRDQKKRDLEIESYIKPMLDVAYSLEEGLERLPLFNDCGTNVSKSLKGLCLAAKNIFKLEPQFKSIFPNAGYYIFKNENLKMIVDAGPTGPRYNSGHVHCDCMSFELFKDGKPLIANCGTYAYQCSERNFFRSTLAHNTVQVYGIEQSNCWGTFRLAKRSLAKVINLTDNSITIKMIDQQKNIIFRTFKLNKSNLSISDSSNGNIISYIHSLEDNINIECDSDIRNKLTSYYSEEFGDLKTISTFVFSGKKNINITIDFYNVTNKTVN